MENIIKKENKTEVNEMIDFLQSLDEKEKQRFKDIIFGYKIATAAMQGKKVN